MKHLMTATTLAVAFLGALLGTSHAQPFNSGSDGSLGALVVTTNTTLTTPTNGVFNYTTITVSNGATLRFTRNALNTPVHLLATGDVTINGTIDVSGSQGNTFVGGVGGPGGFNGGDPGTGGYGPGAGKPGDNSQNPSGAGGGSYATVGPNSATTNKGSTYGSRLVVPLTGGSGGGGAVIGAGGGGGGGAILIASSAQITVSGAVRADGGNRGSGSVQNGGSGGAIRLVAPRVVGNGTLSTGIVDVFQGGGDGRIRVDTQDRSGMALSVTGGTAGASWSTGAFMQVFPPNNPKLDIVETAGTLIPEGTGSLVQVFLPVGSDTNRTVTVQARNFGSIVPIDVVLTPQVGRPIRVQAQIDNTGVNPATVVVPVGFPVNTMTTVNAWTR